MDFNAYHIDKQNLCFNAHARMVCTFRPNFILGSAFSKLPLAAPQIADSRVPDLAEADKAEVCRICARKRAGCNARLALPQHAL